MGIYIKGMKVPASCCKCRFSRWSNYGQCYMCNVCEKPVAKLSTVYENTKPDWCPLVEIPEPYGKLIDDNAMYLALAIVMAGTGSAIEDDMRKE